MTIDIASYFDATSLRELKTAYGRAVAAGKHEFRFADTLFLVAYAKYLIEYLETRVAS